MNSIEALTFAIKALSASADAILQGGIRLPREARSLDAVYQCIEQLAQVRETLIDEQRRQDLAEQRVQIGPNS